MITLGELLKLLNKYGVEIKIAKGTPWEYEVVMKEIIEDYTKWPVKKYIGMDWLYVSEN